MFKTLATKILNDCYRADPTTHKDLVESLGRDLRSMSWAFFFLGATVAVIACGIAQALL